jgi:signal transduction histidine kinase
MEESTSIVNLSLTASLLAMVMAFAIILFALLFNRRKAAHKLELSDLELIKQKDLLYAQVKSSDDERNRIASLLHDDVNNQLTIFKIQLRQLEDKEVRSELNAELDKIISQLRDLSHELSTQQIKRFGLLNELDALKRKLKEQNIELITNQTEQLKELDQDQQVHLYRILQELIGNSIKHGKADKLDLTVEQGTNVLILSYLDNGVGFQPEEKKRTGLGMKNIDSRVQQLQGSWQEEPIPNEGYSFTINIPKT